MIRRIARKEFTEMVRDRRFRWMAASLVLLLGGALLTGWRHFDAVRTDRATARALAQKHWEEQGEKNPHSAAHYGVYVFTPEQPLSLVDRGVEPYTGVFTWIEAHNQNRFEGRPIQDASQIARFGEVTAAGVLQVLLPLLIVLMAFSTFAGEREQGTMRQLLSLGVPARTLAAGKALGVGAALAVVLVPAVLIGAIVLAWSGTASGSGILERALLLAAAHAAYLATFVALTLAVSALAPSSRAALVALLAFWVVNTLLAPRLAADLARRAHPTPTAAQLQAAIQRDYQQGLDGNSPAEARTAELRARLLAEHRVERLQDLPVNFSGVALQAGEEYNNLVLDRHMGALHATFERQERTHRWLAGVSPLIATRAVSMAAAATDAAHHRRFVTAAEEYRRDLQRYLNNDLAFNSRTGDRYVAGAGVWANAPAFTYGPPGLAWVAGQRAVDLLIVAAWLVAAFGAMAMAATRVRP